MDLVHVGAFLYFRLMIHAKPFLPIKQQIKLLQSRGMQIGDASAAEKYLSQIGYYRLSGYWYPLRKSTFTLSASGRPSSVIFDEFREGSHFNTVVDLYIFDKNMRLLMMDIVERIEISIRTQISLQMGNRGPTSHRDKTLLNDRFDSIEIDKATGLPKRAKSDFEDFIDKIDRSERTSKEDFAKHFRQKYSGPMPIWCSTELWEFGTLSKFLSAMKLRDVEKIAKHYDIPRPYLLLSWIRTMAFVRNVCAHHGRLWNKSLAAEPASPKNGEIPLLYHLENDKIALEKFYSAAVIARFFQLKLNPDSDWGERFKTAAKHFPTASGIAIGQAGFPDQWDSFPIWQTYTQP